MRNGKPAKKKRTEFEESSGNVFADLGLPNPEELLAKAKLVLRIDEIIQGQKLTVSKAAAILKLPKNDLLELLRGNLDLFPVDRLFRFLNALDQDVEIVIRPKGKGTAEAATVVVH